MCRLHVEPCGYLKSCLVCILCNLLLIFIFMPFFLKMEEEFGNLKEKLEVSDVKCGLLTDECNKLKHQLEGLLQVKEVRAY